MSDLVATMRFPTTDWKMTVKTTKSVFNHLKGKLVSGRQEARD